jgi:hypothetical protein
MAERSEIFNRLTDPPKKRDTAENRAQSAADFVLGAIRGAVKSVTTDLPGFLLDAADQLAGEVKSFGEKDRSEQMFSAVTGTKKGSSQAETVGSFVNPIAATQAMIIPAALTKSVSKVRDAKAALQWTTDRDKVLIFEDIYKLPENIDDGILRTILDPRGFALKNVNEGTRPLEDVISFPELFAAIPTLKRTPVTFDSSFQGAYMTPWENNKITIGQTDSIPGTILHETQHAIQSIFNMNPGSSPETFLGISPVRLESFKDVLNNLYTEATIAGSFDLGAEIIPIDKMVRELKRKADANYMRTAGEVEARAAELIFADLDPQLSSGLEYMRRALPDRALDKLIKSPASTQKVDANVEWEKLVDKIIDLQAKIEVEKSR